MKRNMGNLDRTIRILLAVFVAALIFSDRINGAAAGVLGAFAMLLFLTGIVGFCPAYLPFHFQTTGRHSQI